MERALKEIHISIKNLLGCNANVGISCGTIASVGCAEKHDKRDIGIPHSQDLKEYFKCL